MISSGSDELGKASETEDFSSESEEDENVIDPSYHRRLSTRLKDSKVSCRLSNGNSKTIAYRIGISLQGVEFTKAGFLMKKTGNLKVDCTYSRLHTMAFPNNIHLDRSNIINSDSGDILCRIPLFF